MERSIRALPALPVPSAVEGSEVEGSEVEWDLDFDRNSFLPRNISQSGIIASRTRPGGGGFVLGWPGVGLSRSKEKWNGSETEIPV